jgi:hypothetical protein
LTRVSIEAEPHIEHVTLVDIPARPIEATSTRSQIGLVDQSHVNVTQVVGRDGDLHSQILPVTLFQVRRVQRNPEGRVFPRPCGVEPSFRILLPIRNFLPPEGARHFARRRVCWPGAGLSWIVRLIHPPVDRP